MKMFKSAWRRCNLKKRISDETAETAFLCNINYLLHLLFIIGVQRTYEETDFTMGISGSAERYRALLGCARYPTIAKSFWFLLNYIPEHPSEGSMHFHACVFVLYRSEIQGLWKN